MHRTWLALIAAALTAAFAAAPAAAGPPAACDPKECVNDVVETVNEQELVKDVMWAIRCAGYALGGNPCY